MSDCKNQTVSNTIVFKYKGYGIVMGLLILAKFKRDTLNSISIDLYINTTKLNFGDRISGSHESLEYRWRQIYIK